MNETEKLAVRIQIINDLITNLVERENLRIDVHALLVGASNALFEAEELLHV